MGPKKYGISNKRMVIEVSFEKYGTDMSELPVSDDQYRELKKLAAEGKAFKMPKNRQEADELLEKIASERNE